MFRGSFIAFILLVANSAPILAQPRFAFVTNGTAEFWTIASLGAKQAGKDLQATVEIHMPEAGVVDQNQILNSLTSKGVDGIAVSLIDPNGQTELLNGVSKKTRVVTHDVDAPKSDRRFHIGGSNYEAGKMAGKTLLKSLPDGGKVAIFVGRVVGAARMRISGILDEVAGNENYDAKRWNLKQENRIKDFSFLPIQVDQFDFRQAKTMPADALQKYPDLKAMIGVFAYNGPACLRALRATQKVGKIKLVAFDEDRVTIEGVRKGEISATIVQNPYQYGYRSIEILSALHRNDKRAIPKQPFVKVPFRVIDRSNVEAFDKKLKTYLKR